MKKLSLIVAMAVVLTMGGVFAAWNYAVTGVADIEQGVTIGVVDVTDQGVAGTLSKSGSLSANIDGGTTNTTVLSPETANYVTITYAKTPTSENKYASVDVTVSISVTGTNTYKTQDVILIGAYESALGTIDGTNTDLTIGFGNSYDLDLTSVITTSSITLATKSDYDDFKATVAPIITIEISATPTPVAP